jgi:hypothetical protein
MRSNSGRFARVLMLVVSLFLLSGAAAKAQSRDGYWDRDQRDDRWEDRQDRRNDRRNRRWGRDYNGGSFQLRQTALNAGYNNGIKEGRKDRSRGERFEYRDEGSYQKATEDYSSRLGDRELYRQYFRQGFENGYRDGYRGY